MFLSLITKNLSWEILTKNLVTFKRWDWVKDEKFWYDGIRGRFSLNNSFVPFAFNIPFI